MGDALLERLERLGRRLNKRPKARAEQPANETAHRDWRLS